VGVAEITQRKNNRRLVQARLPCAHFSLIRERQYIQMAARGILLTAVRPNGQRKAVARWLPRGCPRTEVLFAHTSDRLGPFGAKSMSESPYNPVAAALANAVADATGIRFTALPLKADRIFPALWEKFGTAATGGDGQRADQGAAAPIAP
jgi:hypothetical protein